MTNHKVISQLANSIRQDRAKKGEKITFDQAKSIAFNRLLQRAC